MSKKVEEGGEKGEKRGGGEKRVSNTMKVSQDKKSRRVGHDLWRRQGMGAQPVTFGRSKQYS